MKLGRNDKYSSNYSHSEHGFTLIEMMIVVAIIGIIAAIALPSYNDSVAKGKRTDGQSALFDAASKMEAYFYTNKTYSADLTDIGYASATPSSPEGFYTLGVNAATAGCPISSCYELQATAGAPQTSDGNLTLDSLGRKLPQDKW